MIPHFIRITLLGATVKLPHLKNIPQGKFIKEIKPNNIKAMKLKEWKEDYAQSTRKRSWKEWMNSLGIDEPVIDEVFEQALKAYAEAKCKEQREICRDEINTFGVDDLPEEYHETSDRMEAFVAEHAPAPKMD